ncbi:MAG: PQQ-binding-like beta-propeller repeat protein [Planctomycetota bacterium]
MSARARAGAALSLLMALGCACQEEGVVEPVLGVVRLELAPDSLTQVVGREVEFVARALDGRGREVAGAQIEWGVTDTAHLGLLAPGRVRLRRPGEAVVWARVDSLADSSAVRVAAEGEIRWRRRLDWFATMGGPALSPDGRTLYVLTQVDVNTQSRLWALRAEDGVGLWSLLIDGAAATYPMVGTDGTIYIVGSSVFAVNPDGSFRWVLPIPTAASAALAGGAIADDGILYAATGDELLALDVLTRDTVWAAPISEIGNWVVPPTLDPVAGLLYASQAEGPLFAFDAATGEVLWTRADSFMVLNPGFDATHFAHGPVVADGRVHWPIRAFLETLSPANQVLWLSDDRGCCSTEPLVAPDGTLLWQNGSGFEPRDPATGAVLWRDPIRDQGIGWAGGPALAADGTIYLLASCGPCFPAEPGLAALDASDPGRVHWFYLTNLERPPDSPPDWTRGMLGAPLIGPDGTVYTYNADTLFAFWENAPLAATPWPIWRGDTRRSGVVRR